MSKTPRNKKNIVQALQDEMIAGHKPRKPGNLKRDGCFAFVLFVGVLIIALAAIPQPNTGSRTPSLTSAVQAFVQTNTSMPATATEAPNSALADTPQPTETAAPLSPYGYADAVLTDLSSATLNDVTIVSVQLADGRAKGGERVILITYISPATSQQTINDQWIAILDAVATTIVQQKLDVDSVSLIFGPDEDTTRGILVASVKDLAQYRDQRLTRAQLLGKAKYTPMQLDEGPATPRPASTRRPTNLPRPTRTPRPTVEVPTAQPALSCPRTCATAVARGMSAQDAAKCPGLDRDKDGVACYGD